MKKMLRHTAGLLIGLTVAIPSLNAYAGWDEIERFEDNTRTYVDRKTAHREGDIGKVKHLVRWGEPQIDPGHPPYLSTIVLSEYDCANKHERYLGSTSYAGAMGHGAVIVSDQDEADAWSSFSEDSTEERLWKVACEID